MLTFRSESNRSDVASASQSLAFWGYLPKYLAAAILVSGCEPLIGPTTSALVLNSDEDCIVTVWFKAFISSAAGTLLTPPSAYAGSTAVAGPPVWNSDWYLTDQRGFSNVISASARMHSEIIVKVPPSGYPALSAMTHRTGTSIGISGAVVDCMMAAPTAGMSWSNFRNKGSPKQLVVDLKGTADDPCIWPDSPDLDYHGTLEIKNRRDSGSGHGDVVVRFTGLVDEFPSFEMYATDGDTIITLQKVSNSANTVWALYGGAVVPFSGVGTLCPHDQGGGSPNISEY